MSQFMANAHHTMKAVVRRTGLSPHVIRVWERRYQAVCPERTETNRRLYSEEQVERLALLRDLTQAGQSIGPIARLPTTKLRELARENQGNVERNSAAPAKSGSTPLLEECITCVKQLDARALEDTLNRGAAELGAQGLLQRVIAPLAQAIGDLWRDGTITAAHEHFASAVIRIFLGHTAKTFAAPENAPVLVAATPTGQLHELGAMLAGAAAVHIGWRVTYLGASLPAAEIAGAVRQNRARAVALSLVYPEDDPRIDGELRRLRELLPAEAALLVGGRAAPAYRDAIVAADAQFIKDLKHLGTVLDELRHPSVKRL